MAGVSPMPQDEMPSWVVAATVGIKGDRYYQAKLGEYQGQYFYMYEEAPIEIGDGWTPVYSVLVEEWRWGDTGEPLQ